MEKEAPPRHRLRPRHARRPGGHYLEGEADFTPRAVPPLHLHPFQTETFDVTGGALRVTLGERARVYVAGERFVVGPGTPHAMEAVDPDGARGRWRATPALRTEAFFETMWGLARDGRTDDRGVPSLLQTAVRRTPSASSSSPDPAAGATPRLRPAGAGWAAPRLPRRVPPLQPAGRRLGAPGRRPRLSPP